MPDQPQTVTFNGPGPFALPECSQASVLLSQRAGAEHFVLRLVTAERNQHLFVPISVLALGELKALIDHLVNTRGLGQTKN